MMLSLPMIFVLSFVLTLFGMVAGVAIERHRVPRSTSSITTSPPQIRPPGPPTYVATIKRQISEQQYEARKARAREIASKN